MQKYIKNINIPKLDSFKLRIPLRNCQIINPELNSKFQKILIDTGEILDTVNEPTPIHHIKNGINFRISIIQTNIKMPGSNDKWLNGVKYIIIQPSAKLLKQKYFKGINKKNIRLIYQEIMSYNTFHCSYRTFLKSLIYDIDLAKDNYLKLENYKEALNIIYNASKENQRFLNLFKQYKNVGLEFNKRNSATPTKPFIKIYHKGLELENQSTEFYNKYIKENIKVKNLIRYEATIGNYKHKKRLINKNILPQYTTLFDFLSIENKNLNNFMEHSINNYITKAIKIKSIELSNSKSMLYSMINELIQNGSTIEMLQQHAEAYIGKNQKITLQGINRNKEILNYLIQITLNDEAKNNKIKDNNEVQKFIENLGIKL